MSGQQQSDEYWATDKTQTQTRLNEHSEEWEEANNFVIPLVVSVCCTVIFLVCSVLSGWAGLVAFLVCGVAQTLMWTSKVRPSLVSLWASALCWAFFCVVWMFVWHDFIVR